MAKSQEQRQLIRFYYKFCNSHRAKTKYNEPLFRNFALRSGVGPYSGVGDVSGFYGIDEAVHIRTAFISSSG